MSKVIPATSFRVESQTRANVNAQIQQSAIDHVRQLMNKSNQDINVRMHELDREWDMERLLEFNASSLCIIGILLSMFYSKYWLILSLGVVAFLWQHACMFCLPRLMRYKYKDGVHQYPSSVH